MSAHDRDCARLRVQRYRHAGPRVRSSVRQIGINIPNQGESNGSSKTQTRKRTDHVQSAGRSRARPKAASFRTSVCPSMIVLSIRRPLSPTTSDTPKPTPHWHLRAPSGCAACAAPPRASAAYGFGSNRAAPGFVPAGPLSPLGADDANGHKAIHSKPPLPRASVLHRNAAVP